MLNATCKAQSVGTAALHFALGISHLAFCGLRLNASEQPAKPSLDDQSISAAVESIRIDDLKRHVGTLASDALQGREAGTQGGHAASAYLVQELKKQRVAGGATNGQFLQEFRQRMRNVLAVVPGRDERLRDEVVILGAHFDHVGFGATGNSRGPLGSIHNGADDNASGTAGLLEVIEAIQKLPLAPRRTLLFAFWDGEEQGLLGSSHWVASPTLKLSRVKLSINADMIGRLRSEGVEIVGWRYARGMRSLLCEANSGFEMLRCPKVSLKFTWETLADSDHYPFLAAGIPALMLHTGKHEDYHRPSDDADKLNYEGTQRITQLLLLAALRAAEVDQLPSFRPQGREESKQQQELAERPWPAPPPRLGVTWNPQLVPDRVVEVIDVVAQSPADRAGMRVGDRIIRFGETDVGDVVDFRSLVVTASRDVIATVLRPSVTDPIEVRVRLAGESSQLGMAVRTDDAEPQCLIVAQVLAHSPAALAGLKSQDRIRSFGDYPMNSDSEKLIRRPLPLPIKITYERHGIIAATTLRAITDSSDESTKLPNSSPGSAP